MDQKKIFTLIIVILVVGVVGYFAVIKNQVPVSQNQSPSVDGQKPQNETASWETYSDSQYEFEIRYPSQWSQSIHGPNLVLSATDLNKGDTPTISISSLEQYDKSKLEDIYDGTTEKKIDFRKDCASIAFAGTSAYDCPTGSYLGRHAIFFYNNNIPFVIHDNIDSDISHKIISTFRFIK